MKAICALVFLGLTLAFDDNEFIIRPIHPAFLRHHNKDFEIGESLLDTPKKFLDFDVAKAQKIFHADDNDNELYSTQKVNEDEAVLAIKLLHLVKAIKESQPRNILIDSSENIGDRISMKRKHKKQSKRNKRAESFVGDSVSILRRRLEKILLNNNSKKTY